jgi:hypothetical protein
MTPAWWSPVFPPAQIGPCPRMTGISCTVHVPVMSLQYLEAMKDHRPRHDAIDLSMRELDSCPRRTAAEERKMSLSTQWTFWGSVPCVGLMQTRAAHAARLGLCWPKSCNIPLRSREGYFSIRVNPTVRRGRTAGGQTERPDSRVTEGEVSLGLEGSSEPGGRRS